MPTQEAVTHLKMRPAINGTYNPAANPYNFTLDASNDNSSWTTLLTVTNYTGWVSQTESTWAFTNTTAYYYYRLYFTDSYSDPNMVNIAYFQITGSGSQTPSTIGMGVMNASGATGVISMSANVPLV
jgi:hypothetical protein